MKRKLYQSPSTRVVTMLDVECQILQSSISNRSVKVDPFDETNHYYNGTDAESDYLIKL